jgi:DNA-directed RNA polymerase beta subunit
MRKSDFQATSHTDSTATMASQGTYTTATKKETTKDHQDQNAFPDYRNVLSQYFAQSDGKQIVSHQIESFNQFIEVDIPEIIHMANPISSRGSPEIPLAGPRSALATATGLSTTAANALMGGPADGLTHLGKRIQHEYEVTLEFEKISIRKPTIFENNGAIHPMMPNDARLRNLTYAAPLNIDVKVTTTFIDHTRNGIRESNVRIFPNVHLGKIPVMVGSKYCLLHDQRHVHPSAMGECPEDLGGYFIVQGGERAMISMERMSENRPFVFRNGRGSAKEQEVVEIKCIGPDNDQVPKSNTVKIVYHPKNQLITMLRATVPRIKTDIPLFILFRALGVLPDRDVCELIMGREEEPTYDTVLTESILEAREVRTQEDALAWLAEHTNTWSVKSQKQGNVADILGEELFPQIGGSDMNYEKACFLAHMTRKVLWTSSKRLPTDDRDAYPNKRVDIPGFLLADLFRKTYNNRMVKDMKAALSKEIHGGSWKATGNWSEIVNINNVNKIIKSTIMDVCLKSSLATGNFGSGKIGGPNKVGVSQVLNRLNYSAMISHLRRISTPIEKTGKLIAPRKQHGSQFGMCCPCETPEGHGVGVIKNMSVTATVSIFSSPITVYAFLQGLDRLVSLKMANIDELHFCTRVFLNGSWIGILRSEDTAWVVDQLRGAKRSGKLHMYTGIVWKSAFKELWMTTEAGRILRPLYCAPAVREVMRDESGVLREQLLAIKDWNQLLMWRSPVGHHLIEYVDAGETDAAYIAMDYPSCLKDETYTHCEIHPSVIFGTTASYIPFPDHNQSPRNAYQCLWEEEEVLMATGERKAIKDVVMGEKVMSFDPVTGRMEEVEVVNQYVRETEKKIYRLTTVSGRTVVATDNHPFITETGWQSVAEIVASPEADRMLGIVPNWVFPGADDLSAKARVTGFLLPRDSLSYTFECEEDASEFMRDVTTLGVKFYVSDLTVTLHDEFRESRHVPEWVMSGSDAIKREFLAGFQSHGMLTPGPRTRQEVLVFMKQIQELFAHFGVASEVVENEKYCEMGITLVDAAENLIRCYDAIGYRYSTRAVVEGFKAVECIKAGLRSQTLLKEAMTHRGRMIFVPLESAVEHERVRIADITVANNFHSFITTANIGSHNSSMGKQAMGIYSLNFRQRFDAMAHVLCYPEKPMVSSYMSRIFGAESLPAGQNVIVAIMTYTGYNQEDSNMINRAALDRGRFRSIFYRTYKDEERKNQSSGEEEKFCRPDPTETKHMKNAKYDKVAEDGFIPKDTFVTPDDILIGKVVPLRVPTGTVVPAGAKKSRDVSKMPRNNESGYVDKIYKNRNGEGYSFVKIRMRQDRVPEIGDKFCLTEDHDVLTRGRGWVPIPEVTMEDEVAQLNRETGAMEYVRPLETLVFDHEGEMYEVESQGVSLKTTLNHRMWVRRRGKEAYELVEAKEIVGEAVSYLSDKGEAVPIDARNGVGSEAITSYSGKVYCLRVPTEVFLVRRHGRAVWTGNSSRHG